MIIPIRKRLLFGISFFKRCFILIFLISLLARLFIISFVVITLPFLNILCLCIQTKHHCICTIVWVMFLEKNIGCACAFGRIVSSFTCITLTLQYIAKRYATPYQSLSRLVVCANSQMCTRCGYALRTPHGVYKMQQW